MLTIKDMLKGVRKRVEITPKRGPARFRKQRIEEAVAAQLPEIAGELQVLKQMTAQKELETLTDAVEHLAMVIETEQCLLRVLLSELETDGAQEDDWPAGA